MKKQFLSLVMLLVLPSCGASTPSASSLNGDTVESALLEVFGNDFDFQNVKEVSRKHYEVTAENYPIRYETSTNKDDIKNLLKFLNTPIEEKGSICEKGAIEGSVIDRYTLFDGEDEISFDVYDGASLEAKYSLSCVRADFLSGSVELPNLSSPSKTQYAIHSDLNEVLPVRHYGQKKEIGCFYHFSNLLFSPSKEKMPEKAPFFELDTPAGTASLYSPLLFSMDIGFGTTLFEVTSSHNFISVFNIDEGLVAHDLYVYGNQFSESWIEGGRYRVSTIDEVSSIPNIMADEAINRRFFASYDESYFERKSLVLWSMETPYYSQEVIPSGFDRNENSLVLHANITASTAGWATCGSYLLLYEIPKEDLLGVEYYETTLMPTNYANL